MCHFDMVFLNRGEYFGPIYWYHHRLKIFIFMTCPLCCQRSNHIFNAMFLVMGFQNYLIFCFWWIQVYYKPIILCVCSFIIFVHWVRYCSAISGHHSSLCLSEKGWQHLIIVSLAKRVSRDFCPTLIRVCHVNFITWRVTKQQQQYPPLSHTTARWKPVIRHKVLLLALLVRIWGRLHHTVCLRLTVWDPINANVNINKVSLVCIINQARLWQQDKVVAAISVVPAINFCTTGSF